MLVTDMALQNMDQGTRSALLALRRLFGRWRRQQPTLPLQMVPRDRLSVRVERQVQCRSLSSTETPPCEDIPHRPPAIVDIGSMRTDVPGIEPPFKWRRHPQLRDRDAGSGERSAHDRHRDAEAAALRGLFLARGERLGEARAAFAHAAIDPTVDLTELPGFWDLSRGAMLIAAVAYEDVERYRDASALSARVRTRYRPRAMAPVVTFERRADFGRRG